MPDFDPLMSECNLCGSSDIHLYSIDYNGIQIYKCGNCRIEFMNPQYSDQYLKEFYNSYQVSEQYHHRYGNEDKIREYLHDLNLIDIEKYTQTGRFLSVGCGSGHDLVAAKRRGWQAEGFEVDSQFSQKLSDKLGIPIRSGDFIHLNYQMNYYDCIYLNHVIEHPKSPSVYLKKCHQLLKKQGLLYIACPNIGSLSIRAKKFLEKLRLKSKKGSYYDTWHHLFYFRPAVLRHLLEKQYGFKVILMGNDRKFKRNQFAFFKYIANAQSYNFPYKASFRLIAEKI